jgi:hypothetical protein
MGDGRQETGDKRQEIDDTRLPSPVSSLLQGCFTYNSSTFHIEYGNMALGE